MRSLSWPINRDAIQHAKWEIWSKESDWDAVAEVAKSVGVDIELYAADTFIADLETKYLKDTGVMMNQMFKISLKRCYDTGSQMLIAPPDTIFGGETLPNLLQAGEQKETVVFVVHMRVNPSIIDAIERQANRFGPASSMSNAKLVSLAMEHAHKSWTEAEIGGERSNSFVGGISWKKTPSGVYSVGHRLPTPYLINVTRLDYEFFARENPPGQWPVVFGELDHLYPAYCIYHQGRARVIGSSDHSFIVEITDHESNVPPIEHYDKGEPDSFWRKEYHNGVNRMFSVCFRGE